MGFLGSAAVRVRGSGGVVAGDEVEVVVLQGEGAHLQAGDLPVKAGQA